MDYLDLRDLAEELEKLRNQRADHIDDPEDNPPLDDDEEERLALLNELDNEFNGDLEGYARNEPTAIPVSEFQDYAEQLAQDLGRISGDEGWPLNHIDWEAAAEALKEDYMEFEFDGETYLIRSY